MAEEVQSLEKDVCICGKEANAEDGDCDDLVRLECRFCNMHLLHEACLHKYMKTVLHNVDLLKGPGHIVHNFNCPYSGCPGKVKKIAYLKGHRKNSKKKEARIQGAILASQVAQQSRRAGGAHSKQQQQQQQQQQQKQQLKNACAAAPQKQTAPKASPPTKKPLEPGPSRRTPVSKILPDAQHGTAVQKELTSAQVKLLQSMREAKANARAALGIQPDNISGSSSTGRSSPLPRSALTPAALETGPTVLRSNGSIFSKSAAAQGLGRGSNDANVWGLNALRAAGLAPLGLQAVDEQGQRGAIPGAYFVEAAGFKKSKTQKRKEAKAVLQQQQQQQQQLLREAGPDAVPAARDQESPWITDPSTYKQRLRGMGVEWEEDEEEDEDEEEEEEEESEHMTVQGAWEREGGRDREGEKEGSVEVDAVDGWGVAGQDAWDIATGGWEGGLQDAGWDGGRMGFGERFGEQEVAAAREDATAEEDHEGLLRAAWLEENGGIDAHGVLWFQDGSEWVTAHPDGRMEVMRGPPPLSAFALPGNEELTDPQEQTQAELAHDGSVGFDIDADGWQVFPQDPPLPQHLQFQQPQQPQLLQLQQPQQEQRQQMLQQQPHQMQQEQQQQHSQKPTTFLPWQPLPHNHASNHQQQFELLLQQQEQQQQQQQKCQDQPPTPLPTTVAPSQLPHPATVHGMDPALEIPVSTPSFIPTISPQASHSETLAQNIQALNTTAAPPECSPGALDQVEVDELMSLLCV